MQSTQTRLLRTLLSGFICTLFFVPAFVSAQTSSSDQAYNDLLQKLLLQRQQDAAQPTEIQKSSVGAYLDVKVNPPIPGPNTTVTISIESYLTDLYKANISWSLNGTVLSRGIGKTSFAFENGPSGQSTHVFLSFTTNTGETISRDFYFTPVGATIMWEADTYTPPFYKGKALLSPEARVRLTAVPDITNTENPLGSGNLVYSWKKDNYENPGDSGYGKNTFSFIGPPPLTNTKVTLNVSTIDDSAQSEMQIYLPVAQPFVVFYEKDPLLGVLYNKPLGNEATLSKKEFSLSAVPYFFSNESSDARIIKYAWLINGKRVDNSGRSITLRNDTGITGKSLVSLSVRGINKTFQSASNSLNIKFEGSDTPTPFF